MLAKTDSLLSMTRDPAFWQRTWEEVVHNSLNNRQRRDIPTLDYWNRFSRRMVNWTQEKHTQQRVKKVLEWLVRQGVEIREKEILDIGAGTGTFTIPFLEQGAHVTALEPARAVMEKLTREVEQTNYSKINYLETPWEDLDPEAAGLSGSYDLVFASLVPGIRDVKTLEQMITASRKWCFLCAFAGQKSSNARSVLWQEIMGEAMPLPEHEVIVPLNYLYASGYTPAFEVWNEEWVEEQPCGQVIEDLFHYFHNFVTLTPAVEEKIAAYVRQHQAGGLFCEHFKVRLGMILWSVDSRWS